MADLPSFKNSRQGNVPPKLKQDQSVPSHCPSVQVITVYLQLWELATWPWQWKWCSVRENIFFIYFRPHSDPGDWLLKNYANELFMLRFWLGGVFLVVVVLCYFKKIQWGRTKMVIFEFCMGCNWKWLQRYSISLLLAQHFANKSIWIRSLDAL